MLNPPLDQDEVKGRKWPLAKIASLVVLACSLYLLASNSFFYFVTLSEFKGSALIPSQAAEEMSRFSLRAMIILSLSSATGIFFYLRRRYWITICLCAGVALFLNYFPELVA